MKITAIELYHVSVPLKANLLAHLDTGLSPDAQPFHPDQNYYR